MNMNEPSLFLEGGDDKLVQELEESMPQGVPNSVRPATTLDDDFAGLDDLLAESMEKKNAEDQQKRDREAARKGYPGMSKEEVEFCNSRMRVWEMQREWDADDCIAVFQHFHCLHCDTARVVFSRLMEHHQHRFVKTTSRWVTVKESKIEARTVLEDREVPMCVDCMEEFDFEPIGEDTPWLPDVLNIEEVK
jgi:hypothetical protein